MSNRVYSTDGGKICPGCNRPVASCACAARAANGIANNNSDGVVRVSRETKGRKGAGVTIVRGLKVNQSDLKAIAKTLKQQCGSGGTVKDGDIEIQGDHRPQVKAWLEKQGHKVVLAGG
ncbi:MAG: stress response translation initiation inhibitor YciH [Pseudomonadales bacterium]